MPHIIVEYSASLRDDVSASDLLEALSRTILAQRDERGVAVFPLGGLRARAIKYDECRIADGSEQLGFVHVVLKIGSGRSESVEHAAAAATFETLKEQLGSALRNRPISLSLELQRFSGELSFKHNTIHAFLKEREASARREEPLLTED